ncbi:hypothetical protein Osc2_07860 [Ruminococcus sp. 25CYCFAH16]
MSDNWVVQNLVNALNTWNEKLAEIWQLITQSPEQFKGGTIWNVIVNIHGALQAVGLALLVLFFVVGVMKTCGSFAEVKFLLRTQKISGQYIIHYLSADLTIWLNCLDYQRFH